MTLRLIYSAVTGQFDAAMRAMVRPIAHAATGAIRDASEAVKREGRANIAAAGFSRKWQNALRVKIYPQKGVSVDAAALAFHKIPYAGIFETGGEIRGKPLLWIPIRELPAKIGGQKLTPKLYSERIGPLRFIPPRAGKRPMLAGPLSGRAGTTSKITLARLRKGQSGGSRVISVPLFIGIPAVTERKRFDLKKVFEKARAGLGSGYLRNLDTEL